MSQSESQGTSLLSALFTFIFFGVIGTSVVAIILQTTTSSVNFDLNIIFNILADLSNVVAYGGAVLGFAIGGLIGGVRTKSAEKGFLAGFFGGFLGGLLAFILAAVDDFSLALETGDFGFFGDITLDYIIGMLGIMLAASILGWGAGKTTQNKQKSVKRAQSKVKSWEKTKNWKCTNCGAEIPPGRERCPNCGRPAF